MKTLFSGIQPTGDLHLGNYLGALKQWLELQDQYNSIFCIVDYHSLTENFDPQLKQEQIFNTAVDFLACGIDPKKSIIFVQSHVSAHTELAWIFNCLTPMGELERMTQYKDKSIRQKENINAGLFTYPILMAADILLYKAETVPVGEDQVQHIELARSIAKKFNTKFGNYFPEPKEILTTAKRIMSLSEPSKKMSKSLGEKHYIALKDSGETIAKKIQSAVTDFGSEKNSGLNGGRNLLNLLKEISEDKKLINNFENDYKKETLKYSELKPALTQALVETLKPIQKQRTKLLQDKKYVLEILETGAKKAKGLADKNLTEIKKLIGI
ncbi:MAG TPA: tryptophan--tRNA ligase [bacterium]|nr:tryptophan--tRNA ligase [bacterium]